MEKTITALSIPKEIDKEIAFMLHNYNNIEKLIDQRKNEMIDNMEVTNRAYLSSIHSIHSNTLEDVIEKFETDRNILRLKAWKKLINSFLSKLYDEEDKFYYYFIKYKYLIKMDTEMMHEKLNINYTEEKEIDIYLKWVLYQYAIKVELYKEVA
ncbi:MAG: hypothetical protein IJ690_03915 [Clostridia bacterium]|nr:hypothetical protein [Clostridia bacterium]